MDWNLINFPVISNSKCAANVLQWRIRTKNIKTQPLFFISSWPWEAKGDTLMWLQRRNINNMADTPLICCAHFFVFRREFYSALILSLLFLLLYLLLFSCYSSFHLYFLSSIFIPTHRLHLGGGQGDLPPPTFWETDGLPFSKSKFSGWTACLFFPWLVSHFYTVQKSSGDMKIIPAEWPGRVLTWVTCFQDIPLIN